MLYNYKDTIAAICTPVGQGALGVIRLSGEKALEIASKIFKPAKKTSILDAAANSLTFGLIKDDDLIVDEVIASVMKKPRSYTGEDVVEISAHGGIVVMRKILDLCLKNGARAALGGEFTYRAFLNGKMDLARAEAVADLILSKSDLAISASLNQLQGKLSEKIHSFREKIVSLLASLEAGLDYSEEDIKFISKEEIKSALTNLLEQIKILLDTQEKGRFLRNGLRTTIIGRPNAGKSSLLNAILKRDRSIVTDTPGTTRDVIEETVSINGIPVVIMDTAGLREHSLDSVEKIGQERSLNSIKNADLILWVIDSSENISDDDLYISKYIGSCKKVIVVLNKVDKPAKFDITKTKNIHPALASAVKISALKNEGLKELEEAIYQIINISKISALEPLAINTRHAQIFNKITVSLNETLESLTENFSEEITAFHLREALNSLGEITGETATEEILQNIFSNFCVGK